MKATARRVLWSVAAQRDLDDIVDYIAGDSVINAEGVLDRLQTSAERLTLHAERGRRIPELGRHRRRAPFDWRELIVRPWRVIYSIDGDTVLVLAVVDARRDFRAWLSRRSIRDLARIDE